MKRFPTSRTRLVQFGFKGLSARRSAELTDPAYATSAINFAFDDGCLTGRIGMDEATDAKGKAIPAAPQGIIGLFYYKFVTQEGARDDRIVARLADNSVWYFKLFGDGAWTRVPNFEIRGDDVRAINYNYKGKDELMFCSKGSPLFILDDATPLYCPTAPSFSCFEIHSERLFGGVNGARIRLWFSDDLDPMNWKVSADEAGYITFDDSYGDIIELKSFLGYLFIFREYGIFRLTAFGKQSEFVLKRVFVDTERIVKNSIAFAGGRAVFAAGGKLYDFDGYGVKQIAKNLPEPTNTDGAKATYLDGEYWLAARFGGGSEGNDTIVRFDVGTQELSMLRGASACGLLAVKTGGYDKVLACFSDEEYCAKVGMAARSGEIFGKATKKEYVYAPSTLGTSRLKSVDNISLLTDAEVEVTVSADGKNCTFRFAPCGVAQRVRVGLRGRMIGLSVSSKSANISLPPITAELEIHAN